MEEFVDDDILRRNDFVVFDAYYIGCIIDFRKNVKQTATKSQWSYNSNFCKMNDNLLIRAQLFKIVESNEHFVLKPDNVTYETIFHVNRISKKIPKPRYVNGFPTYELSVGHEIVNFLFNSMDTE